MAKKKQKTDEVIAPSDLGGVKSGVKVHHVVLKNAKEISVDEDTRSDDILSTLVGDYSHAKDSRLFRRLKYLSDFGVDNGVKVVKRGDHISDAETGITVYNRNFVQMHTLLGYLPTLAKDRYNMYERQINNLLQGKDHFGRKIRHDDIIDLDGRSSFKNLFAKYMYAFMFEDANLPTGNLNNFNMTEKSRLISYVTSIADRLTLIPNLDIADSELYRIYENYHSEAEEKTTVANGTEWDPLEKKAYIDDLIRTSIKEFKDLNNRAKERFIVQNLIQPLYRDALINKGELAKMFSYSPIDISMEYGSWLKMNKTGPLLAHFRNVVNAGLTQHSFADSLIALAGVTMSGLSTNKMYAFDAISAGVPLESVRNYKFDQGELVLREYFGEDPDGDNVANEEEASFLEGRVKTVTLKHPSLDCVINRSILLRNIHGEPVVMDDKITALPDFNATPENLMSLLTLRLKLINARFEDSINLDFLTRNPSWEGLIDSRNVDMHLSNDYVIDIVNKLVMDRVFCQATKGSFSGSVLESIFDDANKADLMSSLTGRLSVLDLIYKQTLIVLDELLGLFKQSDEWYDNVIWDELPKLQINIPSEFNPNILTGLKDVFIRTCLNEQQLVSLRSGMLNTENYCFDHAFIPDYVRSLPFYRVLEAANSVGHMAWDVYHMKRFTTNMNCLVDVEHMLDSSVPHFFKANGMSTAKYERLDSISISHPVFQKDSSVFVRDLILDEDDNRPRTGTIYTATVEPTIFVDFSLHLDYKEELPHKYLTTDNGKDLVMNDVIDSTKDIDSDALDMGVSQYSTLKSYLDRIRIVDPIMYMHKFVQSVPYRDVDLILEVHRDNPVFNTKLNPFNVSFTPVQETVTPDKTE